MSERNYFAHPTAVIDEPCSIGEGTKIWHFCHVMKGARIGERCILGQNVFIANDVVIGNDVKIQNNVSNPRFHYPTSKIRNQVFRLLRHFWRSKILKRQ